jgi:hypothetical protein
VKKTLILAAIVAASAAVVPSAKAGEFGYGGCKIGGGWGGYDYWDHVGDFCKKNGVKFSHGYFYPAPMSKHFTEKWYDWRFKTYLHFDPHAHMPYYFCEGHGVWYPISYIETVGPGAKGPGPVIPGAVKGGAVVGGAPVVGGAVGGPVDGPVDGAAVGGAPVGGAGGTPAAPGVVAPAPKADAVPGGAAKAAVTPSPVSVAKKETTPVKEVEAPVGTFDDAIPAPPDIN